MKRKIVKINEDLCNGCGICISACHEEALVLENGKAKLISDVYCDGLGDCLPGCPTGAIEIIEREADAYDEVLVEAKIKESANRENALGHLNNWPVQLKLVSTDNPDFNGADLLIAADCTAFAYGDFHHVFMKDKVTLIGCPKLDDGDYAVKLKEIFLRNNLRSVTVVKMEVPCCTGLLRAVEKALEESDKFIPLQVTTLPRKAK